MDEKRYHIKHGYSVEDVAGQKVLVTPAIGEVDYSKMMVFSESAAFVAGLLIDKSLTFDEIVDALNNEYETDENVVRNELEELLKKFSTYHLLD